MSKCSAGVIFCFLDLFLRRWLLSLEQVLPKNHKKQKFIQPICSPVTTLWTLTVCVSGEITGCYEHNMRKMRAIPENVVTDKTLPVSACSNVVLYMIFHCEGKPDKDLTVTMQTNVLLSELNRKNIWNSYVLWPPWLIIFNNIKYLMKLWKSHITVNQNKTWLQTSLINWYTPSN